MALLSGLYGDNGILPAKLVVEKGWQDLYNILKKLIAE